MKQLTIQFPIQEHRAVQLRTVKNQKPVTWQMNEAEASFLLKMIDENTKMERIIS